MSSRLEEEGKKEKEAFLSAHRCPEADLLPHHKSEARILPPGGEPEVTSTAQSDSNYLDVSSTPHCHRDEDGSISDWSEEDLSLHFSPSVIISSDDEESEGTFECVDITMETLVNGQEGEGPKMVPKRQIQLKKREEENLVKEKKLQMKNAPSEGKDSSSDASAHETLSPRTRQRPDLLLRQHSMPASTTSSDADGYRVYRGLIAGANQGLHVGGNTKQRLQKSFSLDETKAKMASCIIKSVLSKKMQAEAGSKPPQVQNKPTAVPTLPQATEQQRAREGGGGETGGGVPKAPIHVVRDMRSLVKNTYSHTFSTSQNSKPLSFKVVRQGGSPPPSYQQAVGVKVHKQSKHCVGGTVKQVAASQMPSQQRNHRNRPNHPIGQQRRGSEPLINRSKQDDGIRPGAAGLSTKSPDVNNPSKSSGSEKAAGDQAGASLPPSEVSQPPGWPPSSRRPETGQPLVSSQEQSTILGVPSQFVPGNPQQIFHPCFYTPAALPPFATTVVRHMGKVSYVQAPLNYIHSQLQPNLHLLRTPEENQSGLTGRYSNQQVRSPPHLTAEDQRSNSATATPAAQQTAEQQAEQHLQPQQPLVSGLQGFPPVDGCHDALHDSAHSAASTSGASSNVPTPSLMLDPQNLQCFYVDMAAQSQRKMLLDPETGQYVQVFLPAVTPSTTPNSSVFPVGLANPAPLAPTAMKPAPAILSVMQFQPTIALYAPPFLPFPLNTPSMNFPHTPL